MSGLPKSLMAHRVRGVGGTSVVEGDVRWAPAQSLWITGMSLGAVVGGVRYFSWAAFALFLATTGIVLLFGHSLGSHRKLIHDSFQCPRWLERLLVYLGVQVGLAGPLGLLRQHELRDYAQRLPDCHPYLRHGRGFWTDAWWQLHCELRLANPPPLQVEPRIAGDPFYRFLERTWMWQQLPVAILFHAWGGWGFVAYGVCARVTAGVVGHWLIGYLAHNRGAMRHEVRDAAVQGRNVRWTSLLTMGEGWHNNHHAFPGSARLGLYPGEWDPGWWALVALRRAGLAWSLKLPADLASRPEVIAVAPPSAPGAVALRALLRMALDPAPQEPAEIVWPGRRAGIRLVRRIAGPHTTLKLDRGTSRLVLRQSGKVMFGLPALCIASTRGRGLAARVAAAVALPAAAAVERLRARSLAAGA